MPSPPKTFTAAELDRLIEDITVDCYDDDEAFAGFGAALEDVFELPVTGYVLGESVVVERFVSQGDARRGIAVSVRRKGGNAHVLSLVDIAFASGTQVSRYHAAYRHWLGLDPLVPPSDEQGKEDIRPGQTVELIVLMPMTSNARCRLVGTGRALTLRSGAVWGAAPGEVLSVEVRKVWRYGKNDYVSGDIVSRRIDAVALGLVPLSLHDRGSWDPDDELAHYDDEPVESWVKAAMDRGPRRSVEMQQVLPGQGLAVDSDPIGAACDARAFGDLDAARALLVDLLAVDLRCLDAHAHLGLFATQPASAIRHFEMGVGIGDLALGAYFDGVLSHDQLDNRPFLRCLHGYALALWQLGRATEARAAFARLLDINPADHQGVRAMLSMLHEGTDWPGAV